MKRSYEKFWIVFASLNLVPMAALAEGTGPTGYTFLHDELSLEEAAKTFKSFRVEARGEDPDLEVKLFGQVHKDCAEKFTFTHDVLPARGEASQRIAFRISDPNGAGRACVESKKNEACTRANCVGLPSLGGTTLSLSDKPSGQVGIIYMDTFDAENKFDAFSPAIAHRSKEEFAAERRSREAEARAERQRQYQARREALTKEYENQVRTCRSTEQDLEIAMVALDALESMNAIEATRAEQVREELEKRGIEIGLRAFMKRAESDDLEELALLREELSTWADDHSEDSEKLADKLAVIYHKIALRYTKAEGAPQESWNSAEETIKEALKLDGLNASTRAKLENYVRYDIPLARGAAIASHGLSNNFLFGPYYQQLMFQMQQNTMRACNTQSGSMESCAAAMNHMRTAASLPQQAQSVDQQRFQIQKQMWEIQNQTQVAIWNQANANLNGASQQMPQAQAPQSPGSGTFAMTTPSANAGSAFWAGGAYGQTQTHPALNFANGQASPFFPSGR